MLASEALLKAKEILSNEENWCRSGHYADDSLGQSVVPSSNKACKFCTIGVLYKILLPNEPVITSVESSPVDNGIVEKYVRPAVALNSYYGGGIRERIDLDELPWRSVIWFNDAQASHTQLMEMFDKAIELAKADGN